MDAPDVSASDAPGVTSNTSDVPPPLSETNCVPLTCPICLSPMDKEDEIRRLVCTHAFHSECITHWFITSRKHLCPICRTDVENPGNTAVEMVRTASLATDGMLENASSRFPDNFDINNVDHMFGSFTTSEGDHIFVYESTFGIVMMIRTINIPLPTIPQGTRLIPLSQGDVFGRVRDESGGRFRRAFRRVKHALHVFWENLRLCLLPNIHTPL